MNALFWGVRAVGFEHLHNLQVLAFNGNKIKTLRHLKQLVEASTDEYWRQARHIYIYIIVNYIYIRVYICI